MQLLDRPTTDDDTTTQTPHDETTIARTSPASRLVQTVELVKHLQVEERSATEEELALLSGWMGWGPAAQAFEFNTKGHWADIGAQLRLLLGPVGIEHAKAATPHSFFTDAYIAKEMWRIATMLGFDGGRVLEPGCGSGAFLAAAPAALFHKINFTGIEREPFSAAVAKARFPNATIITNALEKVAIIEDSFSLVVGNVPFSSVHIYDREAGINLSLHNYFLWRALRALHPGGLALMITSRYTLDAKRDSQREMIAHYGNLLGAIRLPSNAHKAASTEVVTDILIVQRRSTAIAWQGHAWMDTTNRVVPGIDVNEYFESHLDSIVGTPYIAEHGMYRGEDLKVKAPERLEEWLYEVASRVAHETLANGATYMPPVDITVIGEDLITTREDGRKEGAFHLIDGQLVQIVDGKEVPVTKMVAELTALVRLRDTIVNLLNAERDFERPDEDLLPIRRQLNKLYDAYVKDYGYIHRAKITIGLEDPETGQRTITRRRPAAMYAFCRDPEYPVVLGLEDYDDTDQIGRKAPIFERRVHTRPVRKTSADTPAEALALCLDDHGTLDLSYIADLLKESDVTKVPDLLGDMVYEVPGRSSWVTAAEYLSGNVRVKLEEARKAYERDPERFGRNVKALEAVMPEDILAEEITAILGATWVSPADIEQFCQDVLGQRPVVGHQALTGTWKVHQPPYTGYSAKATSEWGTDRMNAYRLVEVGLNKGVPVVYDEVDDKRVKNAEASLAAQEKLRELQARFATWIWEDQERTTRLAAEYNRLFNSVVPRVYDGTHLTFPGMSEVWADNLYPWQKDFVWRMVSSCSALCGHPVGAGKTTSEIAGAMTLKRLGLVTKAAIVVPNHLLEQITAEAQRLYPGANILMISRDDLTRERRKIFAARIATGDYDCIVMTHSGLSAIGVHPETEKAYIRKRIAAYEEALIEAESEEDGHKKYSVKRLETAIEKMRQRMEELVDKPHDDGVTFEQLGISYLIVDEAHLYKNLGLPTNIPSLQVQASKRAVDLEMKLRWLEEHNEGRPFASFFTATPISNSMVEAYVLAWYLNQKLLEEYNLLTVDAFASTFIDFQTRVEVSPNGASFRLHTRPAKFVNLPEFLTFFTRFADIRSPEILANKRPKRREHIVTIEPTEEVQCYVDSLVQRSEDIHQGRPQSRGGGKIDNMLWVTTDGKKAALDLSLVGWPQEHSLKLEAVASHMLEIFHRWQQDAEYLEGEFKSLQIVFCDLGTPNEEVGDQVYGRLKLLLMLGGIPSKAIRFIHEAKGDSAKALLFQQCRAGEVAVLLGSTPMLGTGVNIQNRCVAIHHVDAPWRPDEVEQREGRGQRPGNLYPEVEIFRYVQRRTFDAYSWQTLANKAVFFDQLRSGKFKGRETEELGDSALSYGQVKAAATGDLLVLEQADLSVTITHLQRLRSSHLRARARDVQEAKYARAAAADAVNRADRLKAIADTALVSKEGFLTVRGVPIADRTEIGDVIAERLVALLNRGGGSDVVGSFKGVLVHLQVYKQGTMYMAEMLFGGDRFTQSSKLVKTHIWQEWINKGQHWRFAQAIEHFIAGAAEKATQESVEAARQLSNANGYEAKSHEIWPQEAELIKQAARKKELDDYTKLVAQSKNDATKSDQIANLRARLLKDAPSESTDIAAITTVPTKIAPPKRPAAKAAVTFTIEAATQTEIVAPLATPSLPEPIVTPVTLQQPPLKQQASWDLFRVRAQEAKKKKDQPKKQQKPVESADLWTETLFTVPTDAIVPLELWAS